MKQLPLPFIPSRKGRGSTRNAKRCLAFDGGGEVGVEKVHQHKHKEKSQ
jgi:hypothetical protein